MKKVYLVLCLIGCLLFTGCSNSVESQVKNNISEVVEVYYYGECENFKGSLSIGRREDSYNYDGVSKGKVNFSVLTLFTGSSDEFIFAEVIVDGKSDKVFLERDLISGAHLVELNKVGKGSKVEVKYLEDKIELVCKSDDFGMSYDDAIRIGSETFRSELNSLIFNNNLKAECYVRVLEDVSNNFIKNYWHFYVYTVEGISYSCVIDVDTGKIIIKN